ncbi:MAG TPA: hypothetical protein VL326_21180 [Kofleriaceae bacterium]|nr:hypothetical protein [Kofleriaceae bacterium]
MAELYQSDVDLAWSDATDDEPHVAPRAAVRARGTRPPPLPGLPPLRRALPLPPPPPVLPEATSTFGRLPPVKVRRGARNDATLIVRPLRDLRMELRPRRRWFVALAALAIVAAVILVATRAHRAAPRAAPAPARVVPKQSAVPTPPSELRAGVSQPKPKPVAKHKAPATTKTVATAAPAKPAKAKAKAPPTKTAAKATKTVAKKKAPEPSSKSSPAKSVTAKTSKQRRR